MIFFNLKNAPTFIVMMLFLGFMTACQKDDIRDVNPELPETNQNANFFETQNRSESENEDDFDEFLCFELNYPIEVVFPDGSKTQVNDDEGLEAEIETWFEANPNAQSFPTLTFPIGITLEDGTPQSVANEDELCDLFEACIEAWEEEIDDDEEGIEELCFDFVYPITVVFPDGSENTVNTDEELEDAIFGWYDSNPNSDDDPTLVYPVQTTLEDGTSTTLNNDEDLESLLDMCDAGIFGDCFRINYPITLIFSDSTTKAVTSDQDLFETIEGWYEANPNDEGDIEVQYPFSVTLADGTVQEINSEEEFDELFIECYGDECRNGNDILLGGAKTAASKVVIAKQEKN